MGILNKKRNLLKPKVNKICYHFKSLKKLFNRGQSFLEYSILIACIILALLAMQTYLKRGIQGKLRESADQIGAQYEPTKTSSDFTISSKSSITTVSTLTIDEETDSTNATTMVTTDYDEQTRKGSETVGAY